MKEEAKCFRMKWLRNGRVAQLGEHLLCKQGVAGSIPATSTIFSSDCKGFPKFISSSIPRFWSHGVNL